MQLTDVQKEAVRQWAAQGLGLSEIQKKLSEEFALAMTYMDVRFLVIEMGVQIKEKKTVTLPRTEGPSASHSKEAVEESDVEDDTDLAGSGPGSSSVSVELDRIMKPGSIVSGTVKFSDGVTASWMLDQTGRLGLSASKPGYRPRQADVQAFQKELHRVLERQGY